MEAARVCANPICSCETFYFTCSLWCGSLDVPAGIRCFCRHDDCIRASAHHPARRGSFGAVPELEYDSPSRRRSARKAVA